MITMIDEKNFNMIPPPKYIRSDQTNFISVAYVIALHAKIAVR